MSNFDSPLLAPRLGLRLLAFIDGALGLSLLFGGNWQLMLRGSWYYLLGGMACTGSSVPQWSASAERAPLQLGLLSAMLAWALWAPMFASTLP